MGGSGADEIPEMRRNGSAMLVSNFMAFSWIDELEYR